MPNSKQNFLEGINLDMDEVRLPTSGNKQYSPYIANLNSFVQQNPQAGAGAGSNELVFTPTEGNNPIPVATGVPANTYTVGFYDSETTNEGYVWNWNADPNLHQLLVIDGDTGNAKIVYQGPLLGLKLNPLNMVGEGRATMILRKYIDPSTDEETQFKFLVWTLGNYPIFCISVEDSINTNSFSLSPYFTDSAGFYDPLLLLMLGVETPINPLSTGTPAPFQPITITEIPYDASSDANKQNYLPRTAWQFRVKFITVYGCESVHGIISQPYISIVGGGCIGESNTLPRGLTLQFDAGSPLVDWIQIEYRKTIGNDAAGAIWSEWAIYETINKYIHTPTAQWYERTPTTYFDVLTNVISYHFYGDKGNILIDTTETLLSQPGVPRSCNTLAVIGEQLGTGNNERGFQPLSQSMLSNIKVTAKLPTDLPCTSIPLKQVIVFAFLTKPSSNVGTGIRTYLLADGTTKVGWGKEFDTSTPCSSPAWYMCQIFADQNNPGFIGYMAGMNNQSYAAISEQGYLNTITSEWTPVPFSTVTAEPTSTISDSVGNKCVLLLRWVFNIYGGKYIFRIASQHAKITDANFRSTSTYCSGRCSMDRTLLQTSTWATSGAYADSVTIPYKEIEIDCSGTSTTYGGTFIASAQILVICDLTDPDISATVNAVDGYYYEDNSSGVPIEMNPVYVQGVSSIGTYSNRSFGSYFTDHNGYYFWVNAFEVKIIIPTDFCDTHGILPRVAVSNDIGVGVCIFTHGNGLGGHPATASPDLFGSPCTFVKGYWNNKVYATGTTGVIPFPNTGRRYAKQTMILCDGVTTIPGIPIVWGKSQAGVTDANGTVTLVAHNRYKYVNPTGYGTWLDGLVPNYSVAPYYNDFLCISQKPGCNWFICGDCTSYTLPDVLIPYPGAGGCSGGDIWTAGTLQVAVYGINIKGVQSGGKYPWSIELFDPIGRHTYAQVLQGEAGFVNIPNLNDATYRAFVLYQLVVNINAAFAAPGFSRLTISIGNNTAFTNLLSWSADWVQFIDETGQDNNVDPSYIRIYYGSLNEYNKNSSFATNSQWQFITNGKTGQGSQTKPASGDLVQFLYNGKPLPSTGSNWFDGVVSVPVVFVLDGVFFTVKYTSELANLTNGALWRVIRPQQNNNIENPYFEQCLTFDLDPITGKVNPAFFSLGATVPIPYFDSYMLFRNLPVPIMGALAATSIVVSTSTSITGAILTKNNQTQYIINQPYESILPGKQPSLPLAYSDSPIEQAGVIPPSIANPQMNHIILMASPNIDILTFYPFLFESPSPSDYWGSHVGSPGRVMFANPYEQQYRVGTEVALSDTFGNRGLLNCMMYFEQKGIQTFPFNTWGDIIAMLVEVSQVLFICEKNHFISKYGTTQLEKAQNGNGIEALNPIGIFTAPQRKSGVDYGCNNYDRNTISRYRGVVRWLSSVGVIIKNTFGDSVAETNTGFIGWLKQAVSQVKQLQQVTTNGLIYWHGGVDPKTGEWYLTVFNIPPGATPAYVNTLLSADQINFQINQTLAIDMNTGILKGFPIVTPEFYGKIPSYIDQTQFISFKQGQPWKHHDSTAVTGFGNFYGVQYPCVIAMIVNEGSEKVKRFFACELYVRYTVPGAAGTWNTPLFYVPPGGIITEQGQYSDIPALISATSSTWSQFWSIRNGFQCAAFLMDTNTPADPNKPYTSGPTAIVDGNQLQGRWLKATFVTNPDWDGSYFELSAINVYFDGEEKTAD